MPGFCELDLPAGSLQCALHAFRGGADAVYFGLKSFSARKGAVNFSFEDVRKLKALCSEGGQYAGKKFYVTVDEREAAVRECLPGNNCGACGYAGCDAMAAAIVAGDAPVNGCPVGGAPCAEKIGGIMGQDAEVLERQVAFVRCKGTCENTRKQGNYVGVTDCRAAALGGVNVGECDYGCMGLGSCVNVCP